MMLAEAMIEKDNLKKLIDRNCEYIKSLLITTDKVNNNINEDILNQKFKDLDGLFNKFQNYKVVINRVSSATTIKVKETELSLKDAIIVRDSMLEKLEIFENFLKTVFKYIKSSKYVICIDINELMKIVDDMMSDMGVLDTQIKYALWSTEV